MAASPLPPSSTPERRGLNPIGVALIVALVVLLSLFLFMCSQRGGTVEQNPGAFGPSAPERITTEDTERIGPPNPPAQDVPLGPSPADFGAPADGAPAEALPEPLPGPPAGQEATPSASAPAPAPR